MKSTKLRRMIQQCSLLLLLLTISGYYGTLRAQNIGDLAYGGIVVDYNSTTKILLVMSLDEVTDDWHDARVWASNYSKDGYTDWRLSELHELQSIYSKWSILNTQISTIGGTGLSDNRYWSGSEYNSNYAWYVGFSNGDVDSSLKNNNCHARAVRALSLNDLTISASHAVIGKDANSKTTNSLAFNNLDGDGTTKVDYHGGTISYSAGNGADKSVAKDDFVDFDNGDYTLATTSNLRSNGNESAIPNSYKTALNGIRRILGGKTDIGAYQSAKELTIGGIKVASKAYDGTTTTVIDLSAATLTGVEVNDDVAIDLSQITATFANKDAGNDKVVNIVGTFGITGDDAHNYILTGQPDVSNLKANITKAKLTVTARNQTMTFGTDPSSLVISTAYDITGFVQGEDETVLGAKPNVKIDNTITSTSVVGDHPGTVLVSGATTNNYDFKYVAGKLTIEKNTGSHLTFPVISNDKKYGGANFNLTSTHGLGKPIRYESSDAGIVHINANNTATILKPGDVTLKAIFDGDDDVAKETKSQTLTIGRAALSLTANNVERAFGETNPDVSNNYTVNTWVNQADATTFSTAPKVKINDSYDQTTSAGNHNNAVIFETEGVHPFYEITHTKGTLIIKQATGAISNTNLPATLSYGDITPTLTGTHAGNNEVKFKSNDPAIVQVEQKNGKWIATALKPGTTILTAYTEVSANHLAAAVTQIITVNKAGLTIRPDDVSRKYGDANPTFNVSVSGLKFADTKADLGTIAVATTADASSPVADYELVASGAANDNYAFTYNKGKLTISQATPAITLTAGTATYTGADLNISPAQTSGIMNNATLAITYEYTKDGVTTSSAREAGDYQVIANLAGDGNHASAVSHAVKFTVHKAAVSIGLTSKSVSYTSQPIPIDAPTITGSATASNLTFSTKYKGTGTTSYPESTQAPTAAGTYSVTVSTAGDSNHLAATSTVTLTISQSTAVITLTDDSFIFDGTAKTQVATTNPIGLPITYAYEGTLMNGTNYPSTDQAPKDAGIYKVRASFAGNNNYEPTAAEANLTINKAPSSISLQNKSVTHTGFPIAIDKPETIPADGVVTITYTKLTRSLLRASAKAPSNVGRYQVEAKLAESNNYLSAQATATLEIVEAGIPTLTFQNKEVVYTGSPQAIEAATITGPGNAANELSLSYSYQGTGYPATSQAPTDAGEYMVTATTSTNANFSKAGSSTAKLTIKKAEQTITFDKVQLEGIMLGDAPFTISGSSTSNLPVSFVSGNPAIASIAGTSITIHQSGTVMITAMQAGNKNYNAASAVALPLNITSDDVSIHELKINGEVHEDISKRYVVPQNYTAPTIPLQLITEGNATVTDFPATADVSKPSLQTIKFSIKAQDGNSTENYELEIEKRFNFDALIVTRWNNTLTVINNAAQHGFTFSAYQWYKNGQAIQGATKQSFSAGKNGEALDPSDDYYVEVTDVASSKVLRCWEAEPKLRSMTIAAYPNPVRQSETLTLEADIDEEYLEGATVSIYNSIGTMVRKQKVTGRSTQIDMSVGVGTYILRLTGTQGFNTNLKIIVR